MPRGLASWCATRRSPSTERAGALTDCRYSEIAGSPFERRARKAWLAQPGRPAFSVQEPERHAIERDENACRFGSARLGPRSKEGQTRRTTNLVFFDESGLSEWPTRVRAGPPEGARADHSDPLQLDAHLRQTSPRGWLCRNGGFENAALRADLVIKPARRGRPCLEGSDLNQLPMPLLSGAHTIL